MMTNMSDVLSEVRRAARLYPLAACAGSFIGAPHGILSACGGFKRRKRTVEPGAETPRDGIEPFAAAAVSEPGSPGRRASGAVDRHHAAMLLGLVDEALQHAQRLAAH